MKNFSVLGQKLSIQVIKNILIEKFDIPKKKTGLKFGFYSDLGFDEWSSFELIEEVEKNFGIDIPWDYNFNNETIGGFANLVCKKFS